MFLVYSANWAQFERLAWTAATILAIHIHSQLHGRSGHGQRLVYIYQLTIVGKGVYMGPRDKYS